MAIYGRVETTLLPNSENYSFQTNTEIENGMVMNMGALVAGERSIYVGAIPTTATMANGEVYLVANPAWNYENPTATSRNEENFVNKADHPYKVYKLRKDNRFKVSDYTIDAIDGSTPIAVGQFVAPQNGSGKLKASTSAPTTGFAGKVIAIDQSGFPFAVGSAGVLDGPFQMVLIQVLSNGAE